MGCVSGVVEKWLGGGWVVVGWWFGGGCGVIEGWLGCGWGVVGGWLHCDSGVVDGDFRSASGDQNPLTEEFSHGHCGSARALGLPAVGQRGSAGPRWPWAI